MIDSSHPHKHGYHVLRAEANRLLCMADDVEKIISLVHRIYGERGLDVLDGVSGGEKTPRDDINEWRAKAESLRKSAYVLQYGDTEEPETVQDPKVPDVEKSCWTCGYNSEPKNLCLHPNVTNADIDDYVQRSGAGRLDHNLMPTDRTIKCPGWKQKPLPIGSVEGP